MTPAGQILFITGTDTDAGKTVLSLLALHALAERDVVYLKPVQTGCRNPDVDSDPAFIHRHLPAGLPGGKTPAECIHTLRLLPKAPLLAGPAVDYCGVLDFIRLHASRHQLVVVEGAGGILVPITPQKTMLDLALDLNAAILVAGRAGLGTINHTLLTLGAIAARGGNCLGTVLLDPAGTTLREARLENAKAIELFSGLPVHGIIDRINDPSRPALADLEILASALRPFLV